MGSQPGALTPGQGPFDVGWLRAEGERLSNAGRWGDDDDLGTWNCVTPAKVVEATACARRGAVFSLALDIGPDLPEVPGRPRPIHFLTLTGTDLAAGRADRGLPTVGFADDWITMNLSCATQWDGFSHVFSDGTTYNGVPASAVSARAGARRASVAALRSAVVTRAVLLDVAGLAGRPWLDPGERIGPDRLDEAAARAGVAIGPGDVVLVRTGALSRVRAERTWDGYAGGPAPGLSVTAASWLAERDVAAVATDTWGVEVMPYEVTGTTAPLHQLLLSRCGITLGEMFDLDALAEDCTADGVCDMLFVAPPLPITGAVNSPLNPLAVK